MDIIKTYRIKVEISSLKNLDFFLDFGIANRTEADGFAALITNDVMSARHE